MRRSIRTDINVSFDPTNFIDGNGNIEPYSFAEAIADECEFAYIEEEEALYRHIGPCWKPGAEFAVEQIARETFENKIQKNMLHEIKQNLKVATRSTRDELLDLPPHELVVANGACVLVLARPISAKYSKFTVNVLRRAVRSASQTNAIAGTTGELAQYH